MNQTDIDKAFEGRWRMKRYILENIDGKAAMEIARDFFEAGIMIGEGFSIDYPEDEKGVPTGQEIIYKHDPIFDTADNGFSEWWDMYGKKVDRKKCIKKWNNLSLNEKQLCLNATPAYVASTPDVAYRKNPLTYLNGECWNDEIIIKNNGTNKPTTDQQRLERLADILAE
jgi:hypothetical protein